MGFVAAAALSVAALLAVLETGPVEAWFCVDAVLSVVAAWLLVAGALIEFVESALDNAGLGVLLLLLVWLEAATVLAYSSFMTC